MKNAWKIVGVVAIVALVLLLCVGSVGMMGLGRFGAFGSRGMMGSYGGYGTASGFHPFGWIVPLIFLAVIVVGIVLCVIWFVQRQSRVATDAPASSTTGSSPSVLEIVKARYAKGEITKEQFDSLKHDLGIAET